MVGGFFSFLAVVLWISAGWGWLNVYKLESLERAHVNLTSLSFFCYLSIHFGNVIPETNEDTPTTRRDKYNEIRFSIVKRAGSSVRNN